MEPIVLNYTKEEAWGGLGSSFYIAAEQLGEPEQVASLHPQFPRL